MMFSMAVALYTSRVVLDVLGVEDFGVYNVVGGVVTLFSFFNSAMSTATQRFFSYEIGKDDLRQLRQTFNASVIIHVLIGVLVLILAETLGLWFVNNKLNLPSNNLSTVQWIYHFSVLTFLIGIIRVPYNAIIIAHERMAAYAYLSIIEVLLKLLIVYLLVVVQTNKLILYAVLVFSVTFLIAITYIIYCNKNFHESRFRFYYDAKLYKILISYSGWNLFGNIAAVAKGQGSNILLNIFIGPIANAAYTISLQVHSAVNLFISNFQLAVNPQIIKSYAANKTEDMFFLITQSSKLSFLLMYILSVPLLFDTNYILNLWLKDVPDYTVSFVFLIALNLLIDSLSGPIMTGIQATGNIKYYQVCIGVLLFCNLPISFFLLRTTEYPEVVFLTSIVLSILALIFRLLFLRRLTGFSVISYVKTVIFRISMVVLFSFIVPYIISNKLEASLFRLFIMIITSSIAIILLSYLIGINRKEKALIKRIIINK